MKLASLALLAAAMGCTKPNPASCLDDNFCSDPSLPYCDKTGSVGGTAGECIAVSCTPGSFLECEDDKTASTCTAGGDNYSPVPCPYGCGASGCVPCNTSDCEKHIIPKYLPAVCDQLTSLPARQFTDNTMIDTTVASNCDSIVTQAGGPEICVLRGSAISVANGMTLKATGTRVLALVGDRDVTIDGTIDVSADRGVSGPGGGIVTSGTSVGKAGGGAGFATPGGAGGGDSGVGGSANGGPAAPRPATTVSLVGGTKPLSAGTATPVGGAGGGLTIISCRASVVVHGIVDAGGGGGNGDEVVAPPFPATYYVASGGGSGGMISLQGIGIDLRTAGLFANGGSGGGGGASLANSQARAGRDGTTSTMFAAGGVGIDGGGDGGLGGALVPAQPGERGTGTTCGGCGAGGGSAGFITTHTPNGTQPSLVGLVVSPPPEPNLSVPTN